MMRYRLLLALSALTWNTVYAETPFQIMELADKSAKVVDSQGEMTMTLSNSEGEQRVRKLVSMTKLKSDGVDNMRVLRFLSPADIKGTVTLLIEQSGQDDDMWIYLPALKKTRRLVSDNKRDSFVGSDLTFGDIIGHKPGDWNHTLLREEVLDARPVYVIESLPKDDSVKTHIGYNKRITWVDKDNHTALKTDYWDENGNPLKTVQVSDVRSVDSMGHWQFMHLEAENRQNGHKTVLHFDSYKADQDLEADAFKPSYLEKDE